MYGTNPAPHLRMDASTRIADQRTIGATRMAETSPTGANTV
jgi:hypothetical protein